MAIRLGANLAAAAELVSSESLLDLVQLIWANDRYFTYPAYQQTAKNVCAKAAEWGVPAQIHPIPADGKTVYGDWKMPLGWDCTDAKLEVAGPNPILLADRATCRTSVIMWSGPTPPEGLTAEVVRVEDRSDLKAKREQVRGKIVYTPAHPMSLKKALAEAGALAVITGHCRFGEQPSDACFWFNGWSDDPNGWAFHAGDTPLPGMALTPQKAHLLQALLRSGPVKVRMRVNSRYFETNMPVVSGVVRGSGPEEVLAIGHSMEQGANDNASGAAVILESLRVLEKGVKAGKLPPLKRSVRGLLVQECYGTVGFAGCNPGVIRNTVAAINWDTLGRFEASTHAKFRQFRSPDAVANVSDTLMLMLLEAWAGKMPFVSITKERAFALTDNAYNDPQWGVQCPYVDSQDRFWHTSADTMEQIDGSTLHAFATVSVAYLHFLATAGAPEALWLAHQTCRRYARKLADVTAISLADLGDTPDRAAWLAGSLDHLAYIREIGERAIRSAQRLMSPAERTENAAALDRIAAHLGQATELEQRWLQESAGCAPAKLPPRVLKVECADIAKLFPQKNFIGTPCYESVPLEKRDASLAPAWDSALHCALFWADGTVTFEEILRRIGYEFGGNHLAGLPAHFRFMAQNGLLKWHKTPVR